MYDNDKNLLIQMHRKQTIYRLYIVRLYIITFSNCDLYISISHSTGCAMSSKLSDVSCCYVSLA